MHNKETLPLEQEMAPLSIDVDKNDFVPEEEIKIVQISLPETELMVIANSLADSISRAWLFSPEDTINDDVIASYGALRLLKKVNSLLAPEKRLGCVIESLLPFEGGDIYIDALYRIDTQLKGKQIAVAAFSYDKNMVAFHLFNPVKYPNARQLSDCLGEAVPLRDINGIEEVQALTQEEMEGFCQAIRDAWGSHY